MPSLRILIVDDHEVIRRGLRSLLSSRPEWEVCGEAADGQAAIDKAQSLQPDLVLMDVTMPVMTGTEAAKAIRSRHDSIEWVRSSFQAGARGYLLKSDTEAELMRALETVTNSGIYASPRLDSSRVRAIVSELGLTVPSELLRSNRVT